jgi:SAM-dependent methyltransferase
VNEPRAWSDRADELSAEAIAAGEPAAWFDRLYAEGVSGETTLAWDTTEPRPMFAEWLASSEAHRDGAGRRALVVGCGLGADAAHVAAHGYDTTAFDVAPTAISLASSRHQRPGLSFHVADLFDLPSPWRSAFDLVVEIFTVQALPRSVRTATIDAVASTVAPGGTLIAIQAIDVDPDPDPDNPPWPLTRDEIESFAAGGQLEQASLGEAAGPWSYSRYWVAEFHRPSASPQA